MTLEHLISLDVGEKRIGVAAGDSSVCIAFPVATIEVDGRELDEIERLVEKNKADIVVVGYPRNQAGQATAQTEYVQKFVSRLANLSAKIVFQDESLTSVLAEKQLQGSKKPYKKGDIDARAAAIILQDYIEENYANRK